MEKLRGRASANAGRFGGGTGRDGSETLETLRQRLLIQEQALVLRTLAIFLDADALQPAAIALVEELRHRFDCERVLLGLGDETGMRLHAASQQSRVSRRAVQTSLIERAMEETVRHDRAVRFDARTDGAVLPDHAALHSGRTELSLLSIPLFHVGEAVGTLMLEQASEPGWSDRTQALLQGLADVLTPVIVMRRDVERPLVHRLSRRVRSVAASALPGTGSATGLAILGVLAALILVGIAPASHQVVADAVVTPIERRLVTAPFPGHVAEVMASAGDRVTAGSTLLRLDRRDLMLQRDRWRTDLESAEAELRLAMAENDTAAMAVLRARRGQAAAEVERIDDQLARAELRAPVDGLVIGGTLDELAGRPVERGETLFEMASAQGYEVELLVDETDMPYVEASHRGHLALTSVPGRKHAFTLHGAHPVALASQGRTRFRVEAQLDSAPGPILPGQTGVGRIDVGDAPLAWVLTHRFGAWARQRLWEWFG